MLFRERDMPFRVTHDTEANAAYIYLCPIDDGDVARTIPVDISPLRGMVNLDFDPQGRLIGVEVIGASNAGKSLGTSRELEVGSWELI